MTLCYRLGWAALCLLSTQAQAQKLSASVMLANDRVERGVSQTSGSGSLAADVQGSHPWGAYIGLGARTVDSEQFGGAQLQWSPRLGWRGSYGAADAGFWDVGLSAHLFPGAQGQRATRLPSSSANAQAQQTDFSTAELNLLLGWRGLSLALDRSLGDYYGIGTEQEQSGPQGQRLRTRLAGSAGSWHAGLRYTHRFNHQLQAWAGAGRQLIQNFEGLSYTDWSLGASLQACGLVWALEGTATNARSDYWRLQGEHTRELASRRGTLSVSWVY